MDKSERRIGWILPIGGSLILTLACIIFGPTKGLMGYAAIGVFVSWYALSLRNMHSAYLAGRRIQDVVLGEAQPDPQAGPEDQRSIDPRAYLIYFFFFASIVGIIYILARTVDKLYEATFLALCVMVGMAMFVWYFQFFYEVQDEQLRDAMNEKRSVFIICSALAGIALVGLLGVSLRLALALL